MVFTLSLRWVLALDYSDILLILVGVGGVVGLGWLLRWLIEPDYVIPEEWWEGRSPVIEEEGEPLN